VLAQITNEFPDDIRFIFRHFPLLRSGDGVVFHDKAALAIQAAEAAGMQGMFWEMHDLLYEQQAAWIELTPEEFELWLVSSAADLGLDTNQFAADLTSEGISAIPERAFEEGLALGLDRTPALFIDGDIVESQFYPYETLQPILKNLIIPLDKLAKIQFSDCPEENVDPDKKYTATIVTEKGDIVIALFPEIAPFAVSNFIFLAESGFYDNTTFHRVEKGHVAQGGDPSATGRGGPGYFFSIEISPSIKFDRRGLFAMANSGPTTNGSQFFITYDALPHLDRQYTIFGEVISGMDVVDSLSPRDPRSLDVPPGDLILEVIIKIID